MSYREHSDLVIAADAGVNWLLAFGVCPDYIVGDLDSARENAVMTFQKMGAKVTTVAREKDETDTFLAAHMALELGAKDVTLFGGTGGDRLDHTYANFLVLDYLTGQGVAAKMVDKHTTVYFVKDQIELKEPPGTVLSLFPFMGEAVVWAPEGSLQYPLDKLRLKGDFPVGISNVFQNEVVHIKVLEGQVLLFINR